MGSPPKKKRSCAASAQRGESPKRGARDTKKSGNVLRQGGGPPSARVTYTFIEAQKTNHRISRMCKVLRVSKSAFGSGSGRCPAYGEDRLYSHRQPRDLRGAEDSLRAEDAGR